MNKITAFPERDIDGNKINIGDIVESKHGQKFFLRFGKNKDTGCYCFYLENTEKDCTTYKIINGKEFKVVGSEFKKLEHHKDTTCGLWATDKPELIPADIKELFFEIKY